jgi:hypothetical protein
MTQHLEVKIAGVPQTDIRVYREMSAYEKQKEFSNSYCLA